MSNLHEKFVIARSLIEKGWTKRASARDADGQPIYFGLDNACSFCTLGAFYRTVYGKGGININDKSHREFDSMVDMLSFVLRGILLPSGALSIMIWNDSVERTHQDVLGALDKCIAECTKLGV